MAKKMRSRKVNRSRRKSVKRSVKRSMKMRSRKVNKSKRRSRKRSMKRLRGGDGDLRDYDLGKGLERVAEGTWAALTYPFVKAGAATAAAGRGGLELLGVLPPPPPPPKPQTQAEKNAALATIQAKEAALQAEEAALQAEAALRGEEAAAPGITESSYIRY